MKSWLKNKTVVITGASGGLGFELAKALIIKYDCKIIGIARNEQKLLNNIEKLNNKKNNFIYKIFDVSINENWLEFKNYLIENNIKIDVLINNAGFMLPFSKFENYSVNNINEIINTNFLSATYSVKALMPLLKKSKNPAIINVSSSAGLCSVVGQSMYSASKYALRAFTECLSIENKDIYVAGIYPGFIKTDIFSKQKCDDKSIKLINKFMMPVNKASKKIIKKINRKRKKIVIGFDGKLLNFGGKYAPFLFPKSMKKVFKISKLDIFNDIK